MIYTSYPCFKHTSSTRCSFGEHRYTRNVMIHATTGQAVSMAELDRKAQYNILQALGGPAVTRGAGTIRSNSKLPT